MTHTPTHPSSAKAHPHPRKRTAVVAAAVALLAVTLLGFLALPATAATSTSGHGETSNIGITHIGVTSTGGANAPVTHPNPNAAAKSTSNNALATPQHPRASAPLGGAGALVFGALCLAAIVATGAGVLWYTVRTRRILD